MAGAFTRCDYCTLIFEIESPERHGTLALPTRIRSLNPDAPRSMRLEITPFGPQLKPEQDPRQQLQICPACLGHFEWMRAYILKFREAITAASSVAVDVEGAVFSEVVRVLDSPQEPRVTDRRRIKC